MPRKIPAIEVQHKAILAEAHRAASSRAQSVQSAATIVRKKSLAPQECRVICKAIDDENWQEIVRTLAQAYNICVPSVNTVDQMIQEVGGKESVWVPASSVSLRNTVLSIKEDVKTGLERRDRAIAGAVYLPPEQAGDTCGRIITTEGMAQLSGKLAQGEVIIHEFFHHAARHLSESALRVKADEMAKGLPGFVLGNILSAPEEAFANGQASAVLAQCRCDSRSEEKTTVDICDQEYSYKQIRALAFQHNVPRHLTKKTEMCAELIKKGML